MRENMRQYVRQNASEERKSDIRLRLAPGMGTWPGPGMGASLAPDIRSRLEPGARARMSPRIGSKPGATEHRRNHGGSMRSIVRRDRSMRSIVRRDRSMGSIVRRGRAMRSIVQCGGTARSIIRCGGSAQSIARRGRYMDRKGRASIVIVLSIVMAFSISVCPAFAASDTPDASSYAIQQAAGPQGSTATVTLGKILTSAKPDSFPGITDFVFTIEPVGGWKNTNTNTGGNGTAVAAADIPMPDAVTTAHQSVTYTSAGAKVLVGDFQNASASNHSAGEGEDTSTKRTRTTPVHITFAKAGYYVYRVKEAGSLPGTEEEPEVPIRNMPGVEYDDNEYFMVFYVCNKIDAQGNTLDDVYVHSITSYTNESGSDTYQPDLTDIQNVTDNGGNAAGENTGEAGTGRPVSHNLGKVGVSDPETPNQLEAYRMWSAFVTQDVVLRKNVTGNLGDRGKFFEFTVTLTGLGSSTTYVTNEAAETGEISTVEITSASTGIKLSGSSFRSSASGQAVLTVKMKDDAIFVLDDLPLRAQYSVCEAASDHVAKYTVTSSNQETGDLAAVIASASGTNNSASNQELTTETETVDRSDGTVTILFTNNRDLATITGVPGLSYTIYAGIALILAAAAVAIIRRRKLYAGDDLFEE